MAYFSKIRWSNLLIDGLLSIFIGAFFIFFSDSLSKIIIFGLGGGLIVTGLFFLVNHYLGKAKNQYNHIYSLVQGIIYMAIGIIVVFKPDLMTDLILYIIGLWLLIAGISQVVYTIKLKKEIGSVNLLLIGGILFILLGLSIFFFQNVIKNISVVLGVLIAFPGVLLLYFSIPVYRLNAKQKTEKESQEEEILHS